MRMDSVCVVFCACAPGFGNAVSQAGSYSAADTTVVAGVRGVDNTASGSGL